MEVILKKIYFQKSSVFFFQENFSQKSSKFLRYQSQVLLKIMYTVKPISSGTMFKVVGFQISNLFFAQNTVIPQSSGCGQP